MIHLKKEKNIHKRQPTNTVFQNDNSCNWTQIQILCVCQKKQNRTKNLSAQI